MLYLINRVFIFLYTWLSQKAVKLAKSLTTIIAFSREAKYERCGDLYDSRFQK